MGSNGLTHREFYDLLPLFQSGDLRPTIDRTFPLKELRDAHVYLDERKQFGKVLIVNE